jgi:hypothetical protein
VSSLTDLATGDYVVGVGIDRNSNGQLDASEVTRRIGVHVAAIGDELYGGTVVGFAGNLGGDGPSLILSGFEFAAETAFCAYRMLADYDSTMTSWEDIYNVLGSGWYADGSLSSIYLKGHGSPGAGVIMGGNNIEGPIPAHVAERIKRKLRPDGRLIVNGCHGVSDSTMVDLQGMANDIQHRVVANTASVWAVGEGQQLWIGYDPR